MAAKEMGQLSLIDALTLDACSHLHLSSMSLPSSVQLQQIRLDCRPWNSRTCAAIPLVDRIEQP